MFAVLAEDKTDAQAIAILVKRIIEIPNCKVLQKGFDGCSKLRRKSWSQIKAFHELGARHFIICHDADKHEPREIKQAIEKALRAKNCFGFSRAIVIPIQELE